MKETRFIKKSIKKFKKYLALREIEYTFIYANEMLNSVRLTACFVNVCSSSCERVNRGEFVGCCSKEYFKKKNIQYQRKQAKENYKKALKRIKAEEEKGVSRE